MDNIRTGRLIAELRKQKGFTQQQLAERVNLSNKTISKWESGSGSPDISNLPILADVLDVSVDEFLKGELDTTKEAKGTTLSQSELTKNSLTTEQIRYVYHSLI